MVLELLKRRFIIIEKTSHLVVFLNSISKHHPENIELKQFACLSSPAGWEILIRSKRDIY